MRRLPRSSRTLLLAAFVLAAAALLAQEGTKPDPVTETLGGADRPRAMISTDKPIYRPGETLFARVLLVDAFDNRPWKESGVHFTVLSPKGEKVTNATSRVADGAGPFEWVIPKETPGGEYVLKAEFPNEGFTPAERRFDVRSFRAPRFRTNIEFVKDGYGPGDRVTATLSATRAEGGIPSGARVTVVARVDGAEAHRSDAVLDAKGECTASFDLPASIVSGEGSLAFLIRDGGVQETAVKTLPILLNRVDLAFYPEGGDLVAGLASRVYFEARDHRQKPADVSGRVLDRAGQTAASFTTDHEGRGVFTLTPAAGEVYTAVLDAPTGNVQRFLVPEVKAAGLTLRSGARVWREGEGQWFFAASTKDRSVRLVLSRFERELCAAKADLKAGEEQGLALTPPAGVQGVLRATLYDEENVPRAERLVFVRPTRAVKIAVTAKPGEGVPGAPVELEIATRDEEGKPVSAMVFLSVTDDAVLEKIEKRERAPRIPAQALLESEVRELADADVYLAGTEEAALATDLLLGTQGWRRFAYHHVGSFLKEHKDQARRALAFRLPPLPPQPTRGVWGERRAMGGAPPPAPGAAPAEGPGDDAGGEEEGGAAPQGDAGEVRQAQGGEAEELPADQKAEKKDRDAEMEDALEEMEKMREARRPAGWRTVVRREYAHRAPADRAGSERRDFADTLYWNAGLKTDENGNAVVAFDLSDSITSFRVLADALSAAGTLGRADALIVSRKPFYLEPKLPLEITAGDLVEAPVALFNGTGAPLSATLKAELGAGLIREGEEPTIALAARSSGRLYLTLVGGAHKGEVAVTLSGAAGPHADRVIRTLPVVPFGFPVEEAFGGRLARTAAGSFTVPASVVPGSVTAKAVVYPSPLATLTEALMGLLREPSGCFEQTSSTAYPNVMALNYLESHHVTDAAVVARSRELLDRGYKRLVGFECKQKGYEWFGGDPGHEALSAYGLMEFADMAKVYDVDGTMMERTRAWLLSRRDGKGGFQRNPRALDSFGGAPQDITDAYIVWALLEAGEKGLEKEVESVASRAAASTDPYFLALAANVLFLANRPQAASVLEKVGASQEKDGAVRGAATSITRSGGDGLVIETTSLAILAWLKSGKHAERVEMAARWLYEKCKGGRFGSTQSTVLALKAILGYDASRARPKAAGAVTLLVDGKEASTIRFTPETEGALEFDDFAGLLTPGTHAVELRMEGGSEMPFAVDVTYHAATPANGPACQVRLQTALSTARIAEGETLEASVVLQSLSDEGLPMTLAIVGLPGGVEPRHDQLKELVKQGKVDFYEVLGREVVLYWRALEPRAARTANLSLVATVPGIYTGPASRAYLYYTDDQKNWAPGLKLTIDRAAD